MNPGPPALDASTLLLGYRGCGKESIFLYFSPYSCIIVGERISWVREKAQRTPGETEGWTKKTTGGITETERRDRERKIRNRKKETGRTQGNHCFTVPS